MTHNLNAAQTAALGAGVSNKLPDPQDVNTGANGSDILIPSQQPLAATSVDGLTAGDQFTIKNDSGTVSDTFTYGGFATGRSVSTGTGGDAGTTLPPTNTQPENIALHGGAITSAGNGTNAVTIDLDTSDGYLHVGSVVNLANLPGVGTITPADLTGSFVVTAGTFNNANGSITINALNPDNTAGGATVPESGNLTERPFAGNILDASTATTAFLGQTGTTGFTAAALSFTITASPQAVRTPSPTPQRLPTRSRDSSTP